MNAAGLRFSGKNQNPIPCWLVGAQSVALNMSNIDLAVQFHFALFKRSGGFLLKPPNMCGPKEAQQPNACPVSAKEMPSGQTNETDEYWPPHREWVQRTTLEILSLHMCPKVGARTHAITLLF